MKQTRMPPAKAANLVANSGNTIYGISVIGPAILKICIKECFIATTKNEKKFQRIGLNQKQAKCNELPGVS